MAFVFLTGCQNEKQNNQKEESTYSFFVGMEALKRLCPEMSDAESGFLQAFDAAINRIHEVADKVYVRGDKGSCSYILVAENF